jgi:hypothetical protein
MFKAVLRTPKEAAGAKAAAEPIRREAMASFMFRLMVCGDMRSNQARKSESEVRVRVYGMVLYCTVPQSAHRGLIPQERSKWRGDLSWQRDDGKR